MSSVNEQAPLVHIVKDSKSEDTAQIVKVDEIYVKNTLPKEDTFFFGEVEPAIEILRDFQNESRVFE